MTNVLRDTAPRYLIRASQGDHEVLERLVSPGMLNGGRTLNLDGIVLDAAYAGRFHEALKGSPFREAIQDKPVQVIVDNQVYRLVDGSREVAALNELPYALNRITEFGHRRVGYVPEDFDPLFVRRFVTAVLDFQTGAGVTDYTAPAFFVDQPSSPWAEVNSVLLRESVRQAGTFLYGTFCGSLQSFDSPETVTSLCDSGVAGAYVLVSPVNARKDSIGKLVRYAETLSALKSRGLSVIAARQPAFGLLMLAAGIGGFDGGIAQSESFDFKTMIRELRRDEGGKARGGGRHRPVYSPILMTSLPREVAAKMFEVPSMRHLFRCEQPCCYESLANALSASREHFAWSREKEMAEIRSHHPSARVHYMAVKLNLAYQNARKLAREFPQHDLNFDHLQRWSSVLEAATATVGGIAR